MRSISFFVMAMFITLSGFGKFTNSTPPSNGNEIAIALANDDAFIEFLNDGLFLAKHIKTEEAKLSFNRIIRKESVTEKELKELGFETLADANTFILKINSNAKGLRGLYLNLLESNYKDFKPLK